MQKIVLINIAGGPIINEGGVAFTEGGLVHALFALAGLASDYDVTIICPNLPGNRQKQINYKGVTITCFGGSGWVRWMHSGSLSFIKEAHGYVKKEQPDILIGNGVLASFLLRFIRGSASKIGIIHHL